MDKSTKYLGDYDCDYACDLPVQNFQNIDLVSEICPHKKIIHCDHPFSYAKSKSIGYCRGSPECDGGGVEGHGKAYSRS